MPIFVQRSGFNIGEVYAVGIVNPTVVIIVLSVKTEPKFSGIHPKLRLYILMKKRHP